MTNGLSELQNKNLVLIEQFYKEVWNNRRIDLLNDFLSEHFVAHYEHADFEGIETYKNMFVNRILDTFPDGTFLILDIVSNNDCVVTRIKASGTQTKELLGLPSSNTFIEVGVMTWFKIMDGKIQQLWSNWNLTYILRERIKEANAEIKSLRKIIPICIYCKNIRDDSGYFKAVEAYISQHSDIDLSHIICPTCMKKYHPDRIKKTKD